MSRRSLEQLSQLVLVDVLSALPLEQLLRLARLGGPGLRRAGSTRWVAARVTGASLGLVTQAQLAESGLGASFCTDILLKRLYGRIEIKFDDLQQVTNLNACIELTNRAPGYLHLYIGFDRVTEKVRDDMCKVFLQRLEKPENVLYVTQIGRPLYLSMFLPNLVYRYRCTAKGRFHRVQYRRQSLNGRPVVDVIRGVEGKLDISETDLDVIRTRAEAEAYQMGGDEWFTEFSGIAFVPHGSDSS